MLVEVWCIQDLMNPFLSFSNTAEKARVLPLIMQYGKPPDFVVAVGTAGFPDKQVSKNGSIVVGSRVFVQTLTRTNPILPPIGAIQSVWIRSSRLAPARALLQVCDSIPSFVARLKPG